MTDEYLGYNVPETNNTITSNKQIQTEEPSFLQNFNKPKTSVNHITFTNNTANYENKMKNDLTISNCFMFLFQTFKEKLIKNKDAYKGFYFD